jgi:hypothetical protein
MLQDAALDALLVRPGKPLARAPEPAPSPIALESQSGFNAVETDLEYEQPPETPPNTQESPPKAAPAAPESLKIPIEHLRRGQCRWPSQIETDDLCSFRFCGLPVQAVGRHEGRRAYCAHHRRIALQHTPSGGLVYAMRQKF